MFFAFFYLNFNNIGIFLILLGSALLFLGLSRLKRLNGRLKLAHRFAFLQLVLIATRLLQKCTLLNSSAELTFWLTLLGLLISALLYISLFAGLKVLVCDMGRGELATGCRVSIGLYAALSVVSTAIYFFLGGQVAQLPFLLVLPFFAVFIYMLAQVHKISAAVDTRPDAVVESSAAGAIIFLTGFLAVTAAACLTAMFVLAHPSVRAQAYARAGSAPAQTVASTRSAMQKAGFDAEILKDLPDAEIAKFDGILSCHNTYETWTPDGGRLKLVSSMSSFQNRRVRFVEYYKWEQPPKHQYADLLGIYVPSVYLADMADSDFSGASLYDEKSTSGNSTLRANLAAQYQETNGSRGRLIAIKYRLFGVKAQNQRGYFAFDKVVTRDFHPITFITSIVYSHGVSFINFPYRDAIDNYKSGGTPSIFAGDGINIDNGRKGAFLQDSFQAEDTYKDS